MKRRPWNRWVAITVAVLCVLSVLVLQQTGAFSAAKSWEEATGYTTIPIQLRGARPTNEEPVIYWLGHSGFFIRWAGTTILIDPILSDRCTFLTRLWPSPVKANDLPKIDAVLLSHAHYDHLDLPTLKGITNLTNIVLPKGSDDFIPKQIVERSSIRGLEMWDAVTVGEIEIIAVPAMHNGSRNHPFESRYRAAGYIMRHGGRSLYFAGDTGSGTHFNIIREKYHPEIAILPIGGYMPTLILRHYHLSPDDAVHAALQLGAKRVIPCHFGTFRMAFDVPESALPLFAAIAAQESLHWEMPTVYDASSILP